jgi:hypothetical protein
MAHYDYYLPSATLRDDKKFKYASRREVSPYHDHSTLEFYHTNKTFSSNDNNNNNSVDKMFLNETTTHSIHQKPVFRNYNQELYENWLNHARDHHAFINDRYLESNYIPTPNGSVFRRNGDFIMTRKDSNYINSNNNNRSLYDNYHSYGINDNDELVINKKNNRSVGVYFNFLFIYSLYTKKTYILLTKSLFYFVLYIKIIF